MMRRATIRISIVCTDRGQHGWTSLGDLTLDGLLRANIGFGYDPRADKRKSECVWVEQPPEQAKPSPDVRVQMRCPRCRRHIQWSAEQARAIVRRLDAAGINSVDISALP